MAEIIQNEAYIPRSQANAYGPYAKTRRDLDSSTDQSLVTIGQMKAIGEMADEQQKRGGKPTPIADDDGGI